MTNWVTIKVPEDDRDEAKAARPEDATWGDVLVAGAVWLNGEQESGVGDLEPFGGEVPDLEQALADAGVSLTYDDVKNACAAAIREELPGVE